MKNLKPVVQIQSVDGQPFVVPDGRYSAKWGGYIVEFSHDGRDFEVTTINGVRGFNVPCHIVIQNSQVFLEFSQ